MLHEFKLNNQENKEYQRLFTDEEYSLYIVYQKTDGRECPVSFLIEYDQAKSSNGSKAVSGTREGYRVGRTDKYLYFQADNGVREFQLKDHFLQRIGELDTEVRGLLLESLSKV